MTVDKRTEFKAKLHALLKEYDVSLSVYHLPYEE